MKTQIQKGFTLVEIAIVLVIVGLLLGGVLKGQELIFNSKVKATYSLSKQMSVAVSGYQDRYKQLPGDDPNALVRFPAAVPAVTNGDGNGAIWGGQTCQAGQQTTENCRALHHLRAAGFISGAGAEALSAPFGGVATIADTNWFLWNGVATTALGLTNGAVTHKSAGAMDTAFDDGTPSSGGVRCASITTYNMATPDVTVPGWCILSM
jgi:prepilin-type N-terminal cleavage/methylation domain-containing protein